MASDLEQQLRLVDQELHQIQGVVLLEWRIIFSFCTCDDDFQVLRFCGFP